MKRELGLTRLIPFKKRALKYQTNRSTGEPVASTVTRMARRARRVDFCQRKHWKRPPPSPPVFGRERFALRSPPFPSRGLISRIEERKTDESVFVRYLPSQCAKNALPQIVPEQIPGLCPEARSRSSGPFQALSQTINTFQLIFQPIQFIRFIT